mgnify:CR=1 FL=1
MIFEIKKRVCFSDTDAAGIVYHSKYLDFCEESRLEFFISTGYTQKRLKEEFNLIFVLKNCDVEFHKPAKVEDLLRVTIEEMILKQPVISMKQNVYLDNTLLVSCNLKLVALNNDFKIVRRLPNEIQEICATIY